MPIYPNYTSCTKCNGQADLLRSRNNGDRCYKCRRCGVVIALPTIYALCNRDPQGGQLEKPIVIESEETVNGYNDCHHCTFYRATRRAIHRRDHCPHLVEWLLKWGRIVNEFPEYIEKYKLITHDP